MLAADAPSVTDWMQGWGNVLGVILSSIAVIFTGLVFRHDRNTRREERADSDAAQARLVVGRLSGYNLNTDGTVRELEYDITNYSDAPVFFVLPLIVNEDSGDEFDSNWTYHVLRPEETVRRRVSIDDPDEPFENEDGTPDLSLFRVKFLFIDKNGLEWRRFNYDTPIRGFNDPVPTWIQRTRLAARERLKRYRYKIKYGPWSPAIRRRKRTVAAIRHGVRQNDSGKPRDLRHDEA